VTAVVALVSSPFRRACRRADEWATFNETNKTTGGSGNRKLSVKIMFLYFELQISGAEEMTVLSRLLPLQFLEKYGQTLRQHGLRNNCL